MTASDSATGGIARPASLLILRIGTGLLLVVWGTLRVVSPASGPGLADKYYGGLFGLPAAQIGFGAAEIALGLLVVLGLFRRLAYVGQAFILIPGTVLLWRYLLDPLGLYLLDKAASQILFFPSITVAGATLVLLAFRQDDRWSLDDLLAGRKAPM